MPVCPGCGSIVEYRRLRHHVQTCPGVWMAGDLEANWNAHLGAETERIEAKLDALLSAIDRLEEGSDARETGEADLATDAEPDTPE